MEIHCRNPSRRAFRLGSGKTNTHVTRRGQQATAQIGALQQQSNDAKSRLSALSTELARTQSEKTQLEGQLASLTQRAAAGEQFELRFKEVSAQLHNPPRIFAVDGDGHKFLLMDLNPHFESLAFAKVEEVTFKTPQHNEIKAGLYWPLDYVPAKKYPLVIQTHAWITNRFWVDGPWTTGFAAQALAGKGFFVLQIDEANNLGPNFSLIDTPEELPAAMAVYDSAIDFLDSKGLIDSTRVGIIGFSRTYLYVTYTLTHSKHPFAAATVIDGVDGSYFQYMAFLNLSETRNTELERLNGALPFGRGLLQWFKVSPAFLMDRVETPLRIQTLGSASLLLDWHWFSGLMRLHKPVEMIYIPDGVHILQKPWERMTSQQGDVDWFCFWLKREEDQNPAKADQYKRRHELRKLQKASEAEKHANRFTPRKCGCYDPSINDR